MRALYKDFFRGMRKNKGKFISVFFIILLGAAFFSGLRSSRTDMLLSAEQYYDGQALMDLSVVSTAGLTDDDVAALSALKEVEKAEGVYTLDALCDSEDRRAVKLISLSETVNVPTVSEGRLPQNDGECLLDTLLLELGSYRLGDTIRFLSGDGTAADTQLERAAFTVVGFADLPQYMDLNRGTGDVGNGEIDGFVLLPKEAFALPAYTQVNLLWKGAKEADSFEAEYDALCADGEAAVSALAPEACARRYDELVAALTAAGVPPQIAASLVETPQWYLLGRDTIFSYVNFQSDAERIASLSQLLPIVFFLVAALVSLTAMTRLVEEERQKIGTLKALGCGNGAVLVRYLAYALLPALFGSVAGVLIGEKLFPLAIMKTYALLYRGLTAFVLPYNLAEGAIAVLASVLSTGLATLAASVNITRERPAQIMRPEAPKKGKRVLIERVPVVWNRLTFTRKATLRNMFRYKKRLFMTVIGVAGCMGLVLVGLGLHDSIMVVADKQFTELTHYQASVAVQELPAAEREELIGEITNGFDGVSAFVLYQKSVEVQGADGMQTVSLSVPETLDGIGDYFTFRTRKGKQAVSVGGQGAIISEKTASALGVGVGDEVRFKDGDVSATVTVTAVYENYIGHYLFLSAETYASLVGEAPPCNQILLRYDDTSDDFQGRLGSALLSDARVQGVSFTSALVDWADDTLSSLNSIVLIVLGAAALLALVVLYNLNSINIAERKRELATLKVLGFYDKEVASYVFRENILLTLLGVVLGVGLGILLHAFVIRSIEVDLIMFGRSIFWYSYLLGAALTLAFSALINLVMYPGLQKIDMIDSLKSAE